MPRPIKDGNNFEINRSIVYNGKDINFHMPSMSACIKHYEIGFQISGSHHVYSTDGEWDILRGYVGTMPLVSAVSLIVYIYKSKIGIYVSIACLVIIFAYGIIMKDSPLQLIIIFMPVIYAMFSTRD